MFRVRGCQPRARRGATQDQSDAHSAAEPHLQRRHHSSRGPPSFDVERDEEEGPRTIAMLGSQARAAAHGQAVRRLAEGVEQKAGEQVDAAVELTLRRERPVLSRDAKRRIEPDARVVARRDLHARAELDGGIVAGDEIEARLGRDRRRRGLLGRCNARSADGGNERPRRSAPAQRRHLGRARQSASV
jgi:hypothetical protein